MDFEIHFSTPAFVIMLMSAVCLLIWYYEFWRKH